MSSHQPVITIHELSIGQAVKTPEATITRTQDGYSVSRRWKGRTFRTAWAAWNAAGCGAVQPLFPADISNVDLYDAISALTQGQAIAIEDMEPEFGAWIVTRLEDGFYIQPPIAPDAVYDEGRPLAASTVAEAVDLLTEDA